MTGKISLLLIFLGWSAAAFAQAAAPQSSSAPPLIIKNYKVDNQVSAEGLETLTVHMEIQPTNEAAAQQYGQQPIPYSETMADVEVTEAYTLKADGEKLPVAPANIYTQSPRSVSAPIFDDQKQKMIVFPDVSGGDTMVYTFVLHSKQPYMPKQIFGSMGFSRLIAFENVDYSVTVPKAMPLFVESREITQQKQETPAATTYHWHYAGPNPLQEDTGVLSSFDRTPRLTYSSFRNYDEFAHNYAALVAPEFTSSDKVRALADQITSGMSDRREQARKIYEWVSRNIRYVGLEFGASAIVPHDADSILANRYGDCKDHVVLFSMLLKAKGIDSQMVLINLGNNYTLPGVGIIGELNHAIAWLPEFQMYADTTAGVAPFGVLPFEEYGKPVVHVVATGSAMHQTPLLAPGAASVTSTTIARVDDQGSVIGKTTTSATGPFSVRLRQIGQAIQAQGPERTAAAVMQQTGTPGTANFIVPSPTDFQPAYAIDSTFSMGPISAVINGARVGMPSKFEMLGVAGDTLIGPLGAQKATNSDPTPCYSGNAVSDISLDAPPGRHFLAAPPDASIKTANLSFVARWTLAGNTLKVHREVMAQFNSALCNGQTRIDMANALKTIRENLSLGFALALDPTPTH